MDRIRSLQNQLKKSKRPTNIDEGNENQPPAPESHDASATHSSLSGTALQTTLDSDASLLSTNVSTESADYPKKDSGFEGSGAPADLFPQPLLSARHETPQADLQRSRFTEKSLLDSASYCRPQSRGEERSVRATPLPRCLSDTRLKYTTPHAGESFNRSASFSQLSADDFVEVNGICYLKFRKLGMGGSSEVWQAYNRESQEEVALKIVRLEGDLAMREGFMNEIEVLKKLQGSPCVIKLIDYQYVNYEDRLYIVLEKGDTDLGTFIKEKFKARQLNKRLIKVYWEEMLKCVRALHQNHIIHKDLKPANFLLVRGHLKLIDFGISLTVPDNKDSVLSDVVLGTVSYMAPETLTAGTAMLKITSKADVWSLGCMLYLMAYGRTPFQKYASQEERAEAICNPKCAIDYSTRQDAILNETIQRCLVRDPYERASVEELLAHPFLDTDVHQSVEDALADMAARLLSSTPNTRLRTLSALSKRTDGAGPHKKLDL
ncbi:unnamed protein product, partial [Mesorhabditis spiculigera]